MNYFLQMAQFGGIPSGDPILKFLHDFAWFCKVAEMGPEGFATVFPTESEVLKILCLDPGPRLREIMASFHSVIAMSATLQPAEFFAHLLGLDQNLECLTLPYPFPMENRQIRIFGQVSTLYKFRSRFARQVAEIIDNTYNEMPGGYFAFFPSYAYMKEVAQYLKSPLLVQNSEMSEEARSEFLQEVAKGGKVFLAVLGGIFAEGVDYPGQLNGVIVVGPGLPLYCLETELQRQYYDEIYGQGFNYAYVFPGMNRVIQAAGRLIRSENDRGTITLIDARFLQEPYRSLIPRDWYVEEVEELRIEKLKAKDEKLKTRV
jgi:Rad3-related DNA helicase